MATTLLIVIYLIFISLGLPDSMLGSSFPAIADNLGVSSDMSGYISMVVCGCTILSALFSDKLIKKFHTKRVVAFSVLLTAVAIILFSLVTKDYVWAFFLIAIPLGLGAGAIDSALNNYVALHYKAIHMNWLHCCWGVGASLGPTIIAPFIDSSNQSAGWNKGILIIGIVQLTIAVITFATLPLWNKVALKNQTKETEQKKEEEKPVSRSVLFTNPIFYLAMFGFFCYCALETLTGAWAGFFFNKGKGVTTQEAATYDSLFYIGVTVGRFICGVFSLKLKEKTMIRIGEAILVLGTILAVVPGDNMFSIVGVGVIGLGCAPIYPAIIRSTPYRFSKSLSQRVMGLEMAIAYCGTLIVSPLYGLIAKNLNNYLLLPYVVLVLAILMIVCHEIINYKLNKRDKNLSEEEKEAYSLI